MHRYVPNTFYMTIILAVVKKRKFNSFLSDCKIEKQVKFYMSSLFVFIWFCWIVYYSNKLVN